MVTDKYIDSLGIDPEKAEILKNALRKDSFYRKVLCKVGIPPAIAEDILRVTDTSDFDEDQAELLEEKARVEWEGFIIPKRK